MPVASPDRIAGATPAETAPPSGAPPPAAVAPATPAERQESDLAALRRGAGRVAGGNGSAPPAADPMPAAAPDAGTGPADAGANTEFPPAGAPPVTPPPAGPDDDDGPGGPAGGADAGDDIKAFVQLDRQGNVLSGDVEVLGRYIKVYGRPGDSRVYEDPDFQVVASTAVQDAVAQKRAADLRMHAERAAQKERLEADVANLPAEDLGRLAHITTRYDSGDGYLAHAMVELPDGSTSRVYGRPRDARVYLDPGFTTPAGATIQGVVDRHRNPPTPAPYLERGKVTVARNGQGDIIGASLAPAGGGGPSISVSLRPGDGRLYTNRLTGETLDAEQAALFRRLSPELAAIAPPPGAGPPTRLDLPTELIKDESALDPGEYAPRIPIATPRPVPPPDPDNVVSGAAAAASSRRNSFASFIRGKQQAKAAAAAATPAPPSGNAGDLAAGRAAGAGRPLFAVSGGKRNGRRGGKRNVVYM